MIFEGGYNLRKTLVFKNFAYIAIFGVIGTLIAFLVVTGLTFGVNSLCIISQLRRADQRLQRPIDRRESIDGNYPHLLCDHLCNRFSSSLDYDKG
jgi:hypothetical protein